MNLMLNLRPLWCRLGQHCDHLVECPDCGELVWLCCWCGWAGGLHSEGNWGHAHRHGHKKLRPQGHGPHMPADTQLKQR